jgi:hypothetical protein
MHVATRNGMQKTDDVACEIKDETEVVLTSMPEMKKYKFLSGDVNWKDYGGKWYRSLGDHIYFVVEFINFEDATGDLVDGNKYAVIGASLDLTPGGCFADHFNSALDTLGWTMKSIDNELQLLEALYVYRGGDHEMTLRGNNADKLLAEVKRNL